MYDLTIRAYDVSAAGMLDGQQKHGHWAALVQTSNSMYERARRRAWLRQMWASWRRQQRTLWHLAALWNDSVIDQAYGGQQTVSLDHIIGSENRADDFDAAFNPLSKHNRARWTSVAGARLQGIALPPVQLIRIGNAYFVRDGHHRISVAKALGQRFIEAEVTVWRVAGPLPWETNARPTSQMAWA